MQASGPGRRLQSAEFVAGLIELKLQIGHLLLQRFAGLNFLLMLVGNVLQALLSLTHLLLPAPAQLPAHQATAHNKTR